jgi:hypothetical protein
MPIHLKPWALPGYSSNASYKGRNIMHHRKARNERQNHPDLQPFFHGLFCVLAQRETLFGSDLFYPVCPVFTLL